MKVEIEGKSYSVLIDLGSSRPLALQRRCIEKILKKESVPVPDFLGIFGKSYHTQGIRIPEAKIVSAVLKNIIISEASLDLFMDSRLPASSGVWGRLKDRLELALISGKIGWAIFREACCYFDFPNSMIYLGKDMPALIAEIGSNLSDFVSTPFDIEDWGLVLWVKTEHGLKKLMLDTGATHSILRRSEQNKNIVEQLTIAGHNFGPWEFVLIEFSDLFQCDGILGVDFFKKHAIYFDFESKVAWIKGLN